MKPYPLHFAGRPHKIIFFECWPHEIKNLSHLFVHIHNKPLITADETTAEIRFADAECSLKKEIRADYTRGN